jgi:hypothetical protein
MLSTTFSFWVAAAIIITLGLLLLRRALNSSKDERLAMAVWAAFGPFRSAADAEEALGRLCACRLWV